MSETAPRHPEIRTMVAFIEGRLAPGERSAVSEHLRGCADCRTVVSETARFEREEQQTAAPAARPKWWLAVAAAVAMVAVLSVAVWKRSNRASSPITRLIAASPRDHRTVDARLSGFPWARLEAPSRGGPAADPADMKLIGAAGEVLEKRPETPDAYHASGVAYLLSGRRAEAIAGLQRAAKDSKDARVWSDLAVARYEAAVEDEHPAQFPPALAAADRALSLDPKLPEALFNRALILERLGIRDQARNAWNEYLSADPGSAWAAEAREHLRKLQEQSQRFDRNLLDRVPPAELVRRFPAETRGYAEGLLLVEWAEAEAGRDETRASAKLALSRSIGAALAAATHEYLLADAVAAIDAADPSSRRTLVDAYLAYRDARVAYSTRNTVKAEPDFVRAAALFAQARSPMANVARYYAASALLGLHRGDESFDALTGLWAKVDRGRHRALAAEIQRSLAVAANAEGDWGAALRAADSAAALFRSLNETRNVAVADGIGAYALEMMGGGDRAWSRHIRTFETLSGTPERARFLRTAAMTLDRFGEPAAAAAIINLAIEDLREDPAQLVAAMNDRARFFQHEGDDRAARATVDRARTAVNGITDAAMRDLLNASIDVTVGAQRRSVDQLERAAAYFSAGRLDRFLPEVYLELARSHRAAGDDGAARADYRAALHAVETQRETIADADLRVQFLDTAAHIVSESIELELGHDSVADAFRIADGSRELTTLDGNSEAPAASALIEYVSFPNEIVAFCVADGELTANRVRVDQATLASRISAFSEKIRRRAGIAEIQADGAALYQLLIAPVEPRLRSMTRLVIVPDRQLVAVPFAALFDPARRQYLVERFSISLAPSASSAGMNDALLLHPAVVIANPKFRDMPLLPSSRLEGERIAAIYGVTPVSGELATPQNFLEAARTSALIHYSGHADADDGALLLAGESGVLPASAIARVSMAARPVIVLAACGTSSMTRAFLLAGARAVVGTLWDVKDDVATPLFVRFHEMIRGGAPPAQALQAAQVELIRTTDPRLRHPATWAPIEITERSFRRTLWLRS